MSHFDFVLVGGGLQNSLVIEALAQRRPEARVAVVERGTLGGNHTWCFHDTDVASRDASLVAPFVAHRWPSHEVRFAGFERVLDHGYAAVTTESLRARVTERAASGQLAIFSKTAATRIEPGRVTLASGQVVQGGVVIDSRGPETAELARVAGFQKFLGLELEVAPGCGPQRPLLMDARVPQIDGFRFFYVLPLSSERVLVEDTYFSDTASLDVPALREAVLGYAQRSGLRIRSVLRQESGVLPLPARVGARPTCEPGLLRGGYAGGWFHPTTGYSFPLAVRLASAVADSPRSELTARVSALASRLAPQQRFCALLNRMLFRALAPADRHGVLERFYRLPASTVQRFYALELSRGDRCRILCGRPPRKLSTRGLLSALAPSAEA